MAGTIRKTLAAMVCALMAVACAFVITGCGGAAASKTEQATKALEDMLGQIENGGLSEYMGDSQMMDLSSMGIDYSEIIEGISDNFSYEIKGAEEDSDGDVTVDVAITSRQIVPAVIKSIDQLYSEVLSTTTNTTNNLQSQDQIMTRYGEIVLEELDNEEPTTTEINVIMTNSNGTWIPTNSSNNEISTAIVGDYANLSQSIKTKISSL